MKEKDYNRTALNDIHKFNSLNPKTVIDFNGEAVIKQKEDKVNHPYHYQWLRDKCNIEPIDICRHLNFNLGNAIKYIIRAGHKKEEGYETIDKEIEDIKKALWYLQDHLNVLVDRRNEMKKPVKKD